MKLFDVIIIGAGLAGLQCAKLLSQQGAKILLVDRKTDLTKGVHTTAIFVRKTFEDFDFPAGVLGRPIRNVILYPPSLRGISLQSSKDEFRVGDMGKLYQSILGDCVENGTSVPSVLCGELVSDETDFLDEIRVVHWYCRTSDTEIVQELTSARAGSTRGGGKRGSLPH